MAIHCTSNQAMRLATIVDREGRSIVKSGSFDICNSVKNSIEVCLFFNLVYLKQYYYFLQHVQIKIYEIKFKKKKIILLN